MRPHLDLTPRDRAVLDGFARRFREALGPNLVALKLFGSKAMGRASSELGLDVLLLVPDGDRETEDRMALSGRSPAAAPPRRP